MKLLLEAVKAGRLFFFGPGVSEVTAPKHRTVVVEICLDCDAILVSEKHRDDLA